MLQFKFSTQLTNFDQVARLKNINKKRNKQRVNKLIVNKPSSSLGYVETFLSKWWGFYICIASKNIDGRLVDCTLK